MEEDSNYQPTPTQTPLMSPAIEQASPPHLNTITAPLVLLATTAITVANNELLSSPNNSMLSLSQSNHTSDFVTPLKKRRIARESLSLDDHPTSLDSSRTLSIDSVVSQAYEGQTVEPSVSDDTRLQLSSELSSPMRSPLKHHEEKEPCGGSQTSVPQPVTARADEEQLVPETVRVLSPTTHMVNYGIY